MKFTLPAVDVDIHFQDTVKQRSLALIGIFQTKLAIQQYTIRTVFKLTFIIYFYYAKLYYTAVYPIETKLPVPMRNQNQRFSSHLSPVNKYYLFLLKRANKTRQQYHNNVSVLMYQCSAFGITNNQISHKQRLPTQGVCCKDVSTQMFKRQNHST